MQVCIEPQVAYMMTKKCTVIVKLFYTSKFFLLFHIAVLIVLCILFGNHTKESVLWT